jgi:hypothetical protein
MNSTNCSTGEPVEDWEDVESELSICPEPDYEERIGLAFDAWRQGQSQPKPPSGRSLAKLFRISKTTLQRRIDRVPSKKEASQAIQRLSPGEEEALRDWIIQLAVWGWPVQVWQLHAIALLLLLRKGDTKLLGIN